MKDDSDATAFEYGLIAAATNLPVSAIIPILTTIATTCSAEPDEGQRRVAIHVNHWRSRDVELGNRGQICRSVDGFYR